MTSSRPPLRQSGLPTSFLVRMATGFLALTLLLVAMATFSLLRSREQHQEQAFVQAGNLTRLLEIQLSDTFDRLDRVLLEAKAELEQRLPAAGVRGADIAMLRDRKTFKLPELDALRVADAQGHLADEDGRWVSNGPVIADRPFFRRLMSDPDAGLVFSEAQVSRASGKRVLVLARRLNQPNGEFAGIVSVSITLEHLENTLASLNLGTNGAITLRDAELRLVTRYPRPPTDGPDTNRISGDLLLALQRQPEGGSYIATTALDHMERADSYRRLAGYHFYILAGLATEDYLAPWRLEVAKTVAFVLALFGLGLLFCWRSYHAWGRRELDLQAISRKEEEFRTLLESAPDALVIVDAQGLIATVNDQAQRMFGYARAEMLGQSIEMLIPAARRARHKTALKDYVDQPHARGMGNVKDLSAVRRDGTEIPVEISLSPLTTDHGRLVMAAIRDVTERQRVIHSLRESEERFRLLVDGVQDYAIYMLSPEGVVLNWNSAAERLKQWRADEVIGRHYSLFYRPEDIAAGMPAEHLAEAARLGHQRTEGFRMRKDGSLFWASLAITAIHAEDGSLRGFAKVTRDITQRRRDEQQEMARSRLLDLIVAKHSLSELLDEVAGGLERQLHGATCALLLRDVFGTSLMVGAAPSLPATLRTALDGLEVSAQNCFGATALSKERVLVTDSSLASAVQDAGVRLLAQSDLVSVWSEPVLAANGEVLGILAVFHQHATNPDAFELGVLARTAQLASIAIERSRSDDALELASSVYAAVGEAIMLVDADNRIEAVNPAFTRLTGYTAEEICGMSPSVLGSGRQDAAFFQGMWHSLQATGHWQGEICNRRKDGSLFTEWLVISTVFDDQGKVRRRIALYSDITEQKRAEEAVWRQANYDPLTRLPNRRLFHDRLEQEVGNAQRNDEQVALFFIDLDHFKEVNDMHGHDVGDALLVDAALRIRNCVRETDTVARLGGDEFTVILGAIHSVQLVREVAAALVTTLAQPFHIGQIRLDIGGSVGIAFFPDHGHDTASLIKNADRAMYIAKREGRGCFRVHAPEAESLPELPPAAPLRH